jgi:hypothetical protein
MVRAIHLQTERHLPKLGLTPRELGALLALRKHRKEQPRQHHKDRDDYQQLDQRERAQPHGK